MACILVYLGSSSLQYNHFKKTIKYDVHKRIPFHYPIGKNEATISIMVEPDPHGDESGTHSHFHTTTICDNMKIVDTPEPDRCGITNSTCPFISPVGKERDTERRKFRYASTIIQKIAFIEFHGLQFVNEILQKKKLKPIDTLSVAELEKILLVSNLIDTETYQKFGKLRHMRNKFAHSPNEYLKFTEKELYDWSHEVDKLSFVVVELLENIDNPENTKEKKATK